MSAVEPAVRRPISRGLPIFIAVLLVQTAVGQSYFHLSNREGPAPCKGP